MATPAQQLQETEDDSDRKYRVILATAGNSTPTEINQTTRLRQELSHGTFAVPLDLTIFEPKNYSESKHPKIGDVQLWGSSFYNGPENWTTGCLLEGSFPEGASVDMSGFYLGGSSFGKLGTESWRPAYAFVCGLQDAQHGQNIRMLFNESLGTEGLNVFSMTVSATLDTHLPVSQRLIIASALERFSKSVAGDRTRALEATSQAINKAGVFSEAAFFAIQMLLNSKRSRRVDDATDLLFSLGLETINSIACLQLLINPPDGNNDNLWYALIRAAGHAGDRNLANQFLGSQFLALQEASVVAIGDVGDSSAKNDLKTIAEDTSRSPLIRELAEELASDLS